MTRKVQCAYLGREAEGMAAPPYPGELGQRIYENISREAWQAWLKHQTMLINEYRLNALDPKSRSMLRDLGSRACCGRRWKSSSLAAGRKSLKAMCRPRAIMIERPTIRE